MRSIPVVVASACALASSGCDQGPTSVPSPPSPPSLPTAVATTTTAPDGSTDAGAPATPLRTILTRSPYGALPDAGELLADGDFEFTGAEVGAPWVSLTATRVVFASGGRCRSGLRCAVLSPGDSIAGLFASPRSGSLVASVHVYVESGGCALASARIVDVAASPTRALADLEPASPDGGPDADGWCTFEGAFAATPFASPRLVVHASGAAPGRVFVDQASVHVGA